MTAGRPSHLARLRDIAKAVGLSHVTVSLALRDHPKIPAERRRQIQAVARLMNYCPDATATALSHFRQGKKDDSGIMTLAWLRPEEQLWESAPGSEVRRCQEAVRAAADTAGYRFVEFDARRSQPLSHLAACLHEHQICGILLPAHLRFSRWQTFPWNLFPTVRLSRAGDPLRVNVVASDGLLNAIKAYEQIHALGYRRIGFAAVGGRPDTLFNQAGFLSAQVADGLSSIPPLLLSGTNPRANRAALVKWLDRHEPDALLAGDADVVESLAESGRRAADDLGLACLNLDGETGSLAGIKHDTEEIARVALAVLTSQVLDSLQGLPPPPPQQVVIDGAWVDGETLPIRR